MTKNKYLRIVGILILIETIILVVITVLSWSLDLKNGNSLLVSLLMVAPPLVYAGIWIRQQGMNYSYVKLVLSFWLILFCSNIVRILIFHFYLNGLYQDTEISIIILVSVAYIIPSILSPLFALKVRQNKASDVIDN